MMAHACNDSIWRLEQEDHCKFKDNLGYMVRHCQNKTTTKTKPISSELSTSEYWAP